MIKKKAKKKRTAKKAGKTRSRLRGKKELNPVEVRKDISELVKSHAGKMAQAVIGEGEKGQLATVKFLWEMAGVYPPSTDGNVSTTDEDCLAKTLLDRLNIPASPVVHDEREKEEDEEVVVIPASVGELKQKGVEESCEEEKEVVAECDQEPLWV